MSHPNALFTLNGSGEPVPASTDDIIAAAREHLSRRLRRGTSLSSPQAVRDFLAVKLGSREFESFCCLFLDNRHRLIEFVELFRGTIDSAAVYPREVVKEALKRNAAALVLAHQHPSGVAEVSAADLDYPQARQCPRDGRDPGSGPSHRRRRRRRQLRRIGTAMKC
jgi:DNA repair protein RadC